MRKRMIYSLLISMAVLMGLLSSCSKKGDTTGLVTRGEWITMLSEAFCLDTYRSNIPYYSDIANESPLFPFVQASAEWGVLSIYDDDKLEPDLPITLDEVASTAAIAAGFRPNGKGEFDIENSIEYSKQYCIINKAGKTYLTADECVTILETAQDVYLANPGEEKIEVEYSDTLVDLRGMTEQAVFVNENELTFPASLNSVDSAIITINGQTVEIRTGNTFLAPATTEQPVGAAYKITSIREENGQVIFSITSPSFGDVYNYADIHTTVYLSDSSIIWANGVQVSPVVLNDSSVGGQGYHIQLLSNRESGGHYVKPDQKSFSHNWKVHFNTGVDPKWMNDIPSFLGDGPEVQALENSNFVYNNIPSLEDFVDSIQTWTKELKKEEKFSDGYDITIDMGLKLTADVDISYYKLDFLNEQIELWPQSAYVVLNSDITADFTFEGSIADEEKFEIGKVSIPIAETGLSIDGSLFLYIDATGTIELKLEIENTQRAGWDIREERQGYQRPVRRPKGNSATTEVSGAIDLSTGFGLEVDLAAFSTINLVCVDLKMGGDLESKGTLTGKCTEQTIDGVVTRHYTETINLGTTFYLPMITLTVSGPDELSDILGLEQSWEIIDKDKALKIPFTEAEWIIWEKTVELDGTGEISFDFSPYVGTYEPYNLTDGQTASPLRINSDGTIWGESGYSGGGVTFSNPLSGNDIKPFSIVTLDNGAIECTLADENFDTTTEDGMSRLGFKILYIIYPPGVVEDESGAYVDWLNETKDKTRIQYLFKDNGIEDIRYCRTNKEENDIHETSDIALFAGVYEPYAKGYGVVSNLSYSSLILNEDGSFQGEYTYSSEDMNVTAEIIGSESIPSQIDYRDDGTIEAVILYIEDYTVVYIIAPPNVDISGYVSAGVDPQAHKEKTRIIYVEGSFGSTADIYYYKP